MVVFSSSQAFLLMIFLSSVTRRPDIHHTVPKPGGVVEAAIEQKKRYNDMHGWGFNLQISSF